MVASCCRFLCYFCRISRQNQKAMFDHLSYLLENSSVGLGEETQFFSPGIIHSYYFILYQFYNIYVTTEIWHSTCRFFVDHIQACTNQQSSLNCCLISV